MTTTDEIVRRALRQVAGRAAAEADTEQALEALEPRRKGTSLVPWLAVAAAIVLVMLVFAATRGGSDGDLIAGESVPTVDTTAATSGPTTAATAPTTQVPTSVPAAAVPATTPPAGTVVEFSGIGDLRLGTSMDRLEGWDRSFELGPACGGVSPTADTWPVLNGLVGGTEGDLAVFAVYTSDARYRTAEGMGVGSTIEELRATYGDRLREAQPQAPVDGVDVDTGVPHAWYGPVASVFDGDRAITFLFSRPDGSTTIVGTVKVSDVAFSGDDEGCA